MGQSVVELQKRDLAMLGSLLCWELLPAWYLAAWYFAGSKRTAENRTGAAAAGRWWWHPPSGVARRGRTCAWARPSWPSRRG